MKWRGKFLTFIPIYFVVLVALFLFSVGYNRTVTVISQTAPLENRQKFIIDAGHGYPDGGATSCTGVLESTINLEIAKRLEDLMHFLGMDTVMIRNTEESVYTQGSTIGEKKVSDLKNRVQMVNKTESGILISIHQNYFHDRKYNGAQVFYSDNADSRQLATTLQNTLVQTVNIGSRRQAKKASGIYLLDHVDCTAVLVECGFLSNPEEEFLLRSEDYQKKMCCVLATCFSTYS